LFLLDGTVASTHETHGQYGYSWVLNDTAAAALGRRFLSTSNARKGQRRYDADRSKGVTLGTIRVPGGSAPGLVDTRGWWFLGRFCGRVDHLKLGWCEFAEGALSTSAVVLGFDPDHDRQS